MLISKIKQLCSLGYLLIVFLVSCVGASHQDSNSDSSVCQVNKTVDFAINGKGDNPAWENAEWIKLVKRKRNENIPLETTVKMLYSENGLYFLFHCEDSLITSTMDADFSDLWNEDVVEIFLWPDENYPVYFEYELSPLNFELPIMVTNLEGELLRWQPFHYMEDRQAIHKTTIVGGEKQPYETVDAWIAEFFIPYKLLLPLNNVPPVNGDKWRANFYRLDYDLEESVSWLWQLTKTNFHDYNSFGTIVFN